MRWPICLWCKLHLILWVVSSSYLNSDQQQGGVWRWRGTSRTGAVDKDQQPKDEIHLAPQEGQVTKCCFNFVLCVCKWFSFLFAGFILTDRWCLWEISSHIVWTSLCICFGFSLMCRLWSRVVTTRTSQDRNHSSSRLDSEGEEEEEEDTDKVKNKTK